VLSSELKLWDVSAGKALLSRAGHFRSLAFSGDGSRLAVSAGQGEAKVYDAVTGAEVLTLAGKSRPGSLALNRDGTLLAGASRTLPPARGTGPEVNVWEVRTGNLRFRLKGHTDPVTEVTFTPDGKRIVSASLPFLVGRGEIKLWDAASGAELLALKPTKPPSPARWLSVSPDGARLFVEQDFLRGASNAEVFDATPRPEAPGPG
jgi:WD40 repeat protein